MLPKNWKQYKVGEVCEICNNLRLPISIEDRTKIQGKYPYYGPTGILSYINEFRIDGKYCLIGEDGDHFLKYKHKPMTFLVEGKFNVNNHAHIIKGTSNCLTEWFYWFFNNRSIASFLSRQGAGRYKLTKVQLMKLPIAIPTIEEQEKIVQILFLWNSNIDKIDQLVEVKEKYKKRTMQNLLKGDGHYKKVKNRKDIYKLKGLVKEVSERNTKYKVNLVLSVTNSHGFRLQSDHFDKVVASKDVENYKIVRKGQFGYNPSRVNVGSIARLEDYDAGILSPMYTIFRTENSKLLPEYMKYFIQTWAFNGQVDYLTQGSVRESLGFDSLEQIEIFLPSTNSQKEIVNLLELLDKELDLLKQKSSLLKQQKKGLMQQLLTGKIRVKVKGEKNNGK